MPLRIDWETVDYFRNRAHVERHLPGHATRGSRFFPRRDALDPFDGVVVLVYTATVQLPDDLETLPPDRFRLEKDGTVKVRIDLEYEIGTQGVVAIADLPPGTPVLRGIRGDGEDAYAVNVARAPQPPTMSLAVYMKRDEDRVWYLHTAFPGIITPERDDEAFWARHAFLDG